MAITEEGADLLMTARQIRVSELRYYFNFGGTVFFHSKLFRGSAREVDHAIVYIGSAIIDSDLDLLAVLQVGFHGLPHDTREGDALLASREGEHRRADQHRRDPQPGNRLDQRELLAVAADAARLGLRLDVADFDGPAGLASLGLLGPGPANVVPDGDVRTVVDEALDKVLLRAAHQGRHRQKEGDPEHHAGERDQRLAPPPGELGERDLELDEHQGGGAVSGRRTRTAALLCRTARRAADSGCGASPKLSSTKR